MTSLKAALDVCRQFGVVRDATKGRLDAYEPATIQGGHAVAFVGYTQSGFIVRNSWGTSWGDSGFTYASNAYAAAAFDGAYGVTVEGAAGSMPAHGKELRQRRFHMHRTADGGGVAVLGGQFAVVSISCVFGRGTAIGQPGMPDRSR